MLIGVATIKPYKKINNQFIGTKFFILGIPLFPVNSYFILGDIIESGVEIGIYWKHLVKIYLGIFTFLISVLLIIPDFISWSTTTKAVIILLHILLFLFIALKFDRMSPQEKELRKGLEKIVHINAMPKYMERRAARNFRNKFIISLKEALDTDKNYEDIIKEKLFTQKEIPLLFAIALYDYRIQPSNLKQQLIDQFYYEMTKSTLPLEVYA